MGFLDFLRRNAPFLVVGALLTFCSSFGQTFFISIFAGRIRDAFDLSNGDWGLIYSIATTASAVLMIFTGILTDTFRVRILGPVVLALLAAACAAMWLAQSWWMLVLAIFALRFFGQGMATLVATVAMARWFVATRGKALSVSRVGIGLGEAFLPLVFVAAMTEANWRALWLWAGGIVVLLLPLLWPLLRLERTPQSISRDDQSSGMNGRHWTRGMMLRHPLYWLLTPMLMATPAFATAFFFHQVHFVTTRDLSHMSLVALFPIYTATSFIAMFGSGAIVDRIGTARLMPIVILPMAAGFALLAFAQSLIATGIVLALFGLTQGLNGTVPAAFWAEFYGTRHLGGIKALAAAVMVFGTAIGPALTGMLIDAGVPFEDQLLGIAVYFVAAAILVGSGIARSAERLSAPA